MPTVLVALIGVAVTLPLATMVMSHPAFKLALPTVPETTVLPLTTALAVVQLAPPTATTVTVKVGVIRIGRVSVNVRVPTTPPKLRI